MTLNALLPLTGSQVETIRRKRWETGCSVVYLHPLASPGLVGPVRVQFDDATPLLLDEVGREVGEDEIGRVA